MLEAADGLPINLGFLGKGNCSPPEPLREQVVAGAIGLKLHEDWGTTPAAIDCCLAVADELDVQVAIHTDTLNEAGFVEDSIRAFKGRTIHTYPHAKAPAAATRPTSSASAASRTCCRPRTNPTTAVHGEHDRRAPRHAHGVPSPRRRTSPRTWPSPRSRIRAETIAAEDVLHDLGAISMMSLGLAGDGPHRRGDHAHVADRPQDEGAARARCPATAANDNARAKRYVAKYTINPAITHGIAARRRLASRSGKLADLVVWKPAFFGVKPELVLKGGLIVTAAMGDPNATIPTPQPVRYRPMFAAYGGALRSTSLTFLSRAALDDGVPARLGLRKTVRAGGGLPRARQGVDDPQRRTARASRSTPRRTRCAPTASSSPASRPRVLPMAQRYFLF